MDPCDLGTCDICGAPAVTYVLTLTVSGYTVGAVEFSFDQRVVFSTYGDNRPRACQEHRRDLVDRLVRRVAPKPIQAFQSFNWAAEMSDRSNQEGRIRRP